VFTAFLAAAALALGACGGDDEEATTEATAPAPEEEVEQVVADFGQAEGADACDYVSQSYLDQLGGVSGCDKEFAEAVAVDYAISDVQVDGTTATATAETDDQTVAFELVDEEGEWKISSAGPPDDGATTEADTSSDEAAVEQVVADFGLAEGSTACDYVSQEYLSTVGGQSGCDKEFAEAVGVKYDISNVQVNGDTATAQAETDDQTIAFELVREGSDWKISSAGPG
jgi:hypothetical protein